MSGVRGRAEALRRGLQMRAPLKHHAVCPTTRWTHPALALLLCCRYLCTAAGPLPLASAGEPAAPLDTISEGSGSLAAGAAAPGGYPTLPLIPARFPVHISYHCFEVNRSDASAS